MTESQERFVRAILERLPAGRVVELHLFPALRQGATETGVAVIAARRAGSGDVEGTDGTDGGAQPPAGGPGGPPPEGQFEAADATDHHHPAAPAADSAHADAAERDEERVAPKPGRGAASGRRAARPARRVAQEPGVRHTVFMARYRLAIRGAERGRWEFDLVEEADAPLVTVDAVVRGVQERAGEGGEPERLGPDALAALAGGRGAPWTTAAR